MRICSTVSARSAGSFAIIGLLQRSISAIRPSVIGILAVGVEVAKLHLNRTPDGRLRSHNGISTTSVDAN